MSSFYKVTLAMPVYNVEKYVERALLSALNQTFDSIEFLIIDDRGQDESMDIVHRVVSEHPRGKEVRIIEHFVNQGLGATRNTAIKEARGKYLCFMDSDDEITVDCIQTLYKEITDENIDLVIGSYSTVTERIEEGSASLCEDERLEGKGCLIDYIEGNNFVPVSTWNKLYRVDYLRENRIYCIPNHLNEDVWLFFQIILTANKCCLSSRITYFYYKIENSITDFYSFTEEKKQRITSQYIGIDELKKRELQKFVSDSIFPLLLCITMRESLRLAYEVFCLNTPAKKLNVLSKFIRRYRNKSSRHAIRCFMVYPITIKGILKMSKRKKENFIYWLVSYFPSFLQYVFVVIVRFIKK